MPKFENGGFGEKFGRIIDKQNSEVGFSDSDHVYFNLNDGGTYVSVTQLIHNYVPEFSESF